MKKSKTPKWQNWDKHYTGRSLSDLDIEILKFLWKWKLSPIRVLYQALAREMSPNSFNKRIKKLERHKLIQSQWDFIYGFHAWELCEFGMYVIRESLGEIQNLGFRSASPPHDRLVLAFHLGEWIYEHHRKPVLITEQELLKYPEDILSNLVPSTQDHRPDGYTLLVNGEERKLFAIEVELHAKSKSRYQTLITWYSLKKEIHQVLWLVADDFIKAQILAAKSEARELSENYHLFVDLKDYLKNGWEAIVKNEFGVHLKTLRALWRGSEGLALGDNAETQGDQKNINTFTDHRKYLVIKGS